MTIALRPYQESGMAAIREAFRGGARRVCAVAPTGSGKGTLGAYVIHGAWRRGVRVLFAVHRRELINDIYRRLTLQAGVDRVGVILGGDKRRDPHAAVQVASIDSLRGRAAALGRFGLVVIDECHRAQTAGYRALLAAQPDARVLGLTATPVRLDGRSLKEIFDALVVFARPEALVRDGWIVAPDIFTIDEDHRPDMAGARTVAGDYSAAELDARVTPKVVGAIAPHWLRHAAGRVTIVAAHSVAAAETIAASFVAHGVDARVVHGAMKLAARDAVIAAFRAREFPVIVQCNLLAAGYDFPDVKCIVIARPTDSRTFHFQLCGRAMRPSYGETALILDHVGNVLRHGAPQDDQPWEELWEEARKSRAVKCHKVCPGTPEAGFCGNTVPIATEVCPVCGHVFATADEAGESTPRSLLQVDGELVKYGRRAPPSLEVQRAWWDKHAEKEAIRALGDPGLRAAFRARFGLEAPADWPPPTPVNRLSPLEKSKLWGRLLYDADRRGRDERWALSAYRAQVGEDPPHPVLPPPPRAPRQLAR